MGPASAQADTSRDREKRERVRIRELERLRRSRRTRKTSSRFVAGAVALVVNASLVAALGTRSYGSVGLRATASPEAISVVLLPAVSPLIEPPHLHWVPRAPRIHAPAPHFPALVDVRVGLGPPTETVALVSDEPELTAKVLDPADVQQACRTAYPNEFTSQRGDVTVRVYVMADGRIGQGNVVTSSGDGHLDWMTMKCLQAYAHLAADEDAPTGAWQRLTWNWAAP